MTVLDRATRAILKRRYYDCEPKMYASLDEFFASMESMSPDQWDEARDEARAVVEAMRDATAGQCGAIGLNINAAAVWTAMIDAALKED